jgi:hypothetical protein
MVEMILKTRMINVQNIGATAAGALPENVPGLIEMIPDDELYAATGKRSGFTWDDLAKVMGMSASLWALIAPFIPRNNQNQPIAPIPPRPAPSTDVGRIAIWLGLGLGAFLLIRR